MIARSWVLKPSACLSEQRRLPGVQDANRTSDAVATTVGIVVLWPVLFAIKGDGNNAAELARLKGEMEALEGKSIRKKCGITFQRSAPPT